MRFASGRGNCMDESFDVEVAYAAPARQLILCLRVSRGCTVAQAVKHSGILAEFLEIDLTTAKIGIFGQAVKQDTCLHAGDRVEIYRPLLIDPKQARFKRVAEKRVRPGSL